MTSDDVLEQLISLMVGLITKSPIASVTIGLTLKDVKHWVQDGPDQSWIAINIGAAGLWDLKKMRDADEAATIHMSLPEIAQPNMSTFVPIGKDLWFVPVPGHSGSFEVWERDPIETPDRKINWNVYRFN